MRITWKWQTSLFVITCKKTCDALPKLSIWKQKLSIQICRLQPCRVALVFRKVSFCPFLLIVSWIPIGFNLLYDIIAPLSQSAPDRVLRLPWSFADKTCLSMSISDCAHMWLFAVKSMAPFYHPFIHTLLLVFPDLKMSDKIRNFNIV